MKRALSLIAPLALASALVPAFAAPSFEALYGRALAADAKSARLSLEEERARIVYARATLARGSPAFSAKTGSLSASLYGSTTAFSTSTFSASPSAELALPSGTTIGLAIPAVAYSSGAYALPRVDLGLPLIKGSDKSLVEAETALRSWRLAKAAVDRAALELERKLATALKAALDAEISLQSALREEAKQEREFERARAVDGAEPGGTAYMSLQRKQREAARTRRDAEAKKTTALTALRDLIGELPGDEALPNDFPEPDMARALPAPEAGYECSNAQDAARLEELSEAQAERRNSVKADLGAGFGLGSSAIGKEDELGTAGLLVSAGIASSLGREGLELSGALAWGPDAGPSLSLTMSWAPKPKGDEALRGRDLALAAALRDRSRAEALAAARSAVAALETSRTDLARAAQYAVEYLSFAEEQRTAYAARLERGIVSQSEYDEVLAERDECAARLRAAKLDRITWDIDARLVFAGAQVFGERP